MAEVTHGKVAQGCRNRSQEALMVEHIKHYHGGDRHSHVW